MYFGTLKQNNNEFIDFVCLKNMRIFIVMSGKQLDGIITDGKFGVFWDIYSDSVKLDVLHSDK